MNQIIFFATFKNILNNGFALLYIFLGLEKTSNQLYEQVGTHPEENNDHEDSPREKY